MTQKLEIQIVADAKQLERALSRSNQASSQWARGLQTASKGALVAFGALGVGAAASVKAASNLEEQINKTSVVFRGSEKAIHAWSETTAESFGISQRAALEAAGTFGNMLVPMGIARDRASEMSTRFVELAADMASFNNASPEETLDALRAGLAGETEPLRRFGVFLNEARIKQEALNLGLVKGKEKLTAAQKAQATYSIILKDTADAQGDFERTSDSLANQQRVLRAQFEDTAAALGQALLPVATDAAGVLLDLVNVAKDNKTAFQVLAGTAAALSAGILLLNTSVKIYTSSTLAALGATRALRIAMAVTPWAAAIVGAGFLIEALLRQKDSAGAAEEAQRDLTDALKDYQAAVKDGKNAALDLESANLRLERAEINVKQAVLDRNRVDKDSTSTQLDKREAGLRVLEAMNELRRAEIDVAAAADKGRESQIKQNNASKALIGSFGALTAKFQDNTTEQKRFSRTGRDTQGVLRNVAVNAGAARRNANEYANALENMAEKARASNPRLARTAELAATLARAWGRVVSLPAAREFVARFRIITTVEENRLNNPLHRQHGGPVQANRAYIVGEDGPELYVPDRGGRIIPNGGGGTAASGGGFVKVIVVGGDRGGIDWIQGLDRDYRRQNGGRGLLA